MAGLEYAPQEGKQQATTELINAETQRANKEASGYVASDLAGKLSNVQDQKFLRGENGAKFILMVAQADRKDLKRVVEAYVPPFQKEQQNRMLELAMGADIRKEFIKQKTRIYAKEAGEGIVAKDWGKVEAVNRAVKQDGDVKEVDYANGVNSYMQEKAPEKWDTDAKQKFLSTLANAGFAASVIQQFSQQWGAAAPATTLSREASVRQALQQSVEAVNRALEELGNLSKSKLGDALERTDGAAVRQARRALRGDSKIAEQLEKAAEGKKELDTLIENAARIVARAAAESQQTPAATMSVINGNAELRAKLMEIATKI